MDRPNRKANRLEKYDYAQEGAYFITLCTHKRARLFNMEYHTPKVCITTTSVESKTVNIPLTSVQNRLIHKCIEKTNEKFQNAEIDKYVIMPDHVHFLITIKERHDGRSLPDIMHYFKTMTTNEYISKVKSGKLRPFDKKLWQKSYYDHVIRNQQDYNECWEYIENNPLKWLIDHNIEI